MATRPASESLAAAGSAVDARFWTRRVGGGAVLGSAIASLDFAHYLPLASAPDALSLGSFLSSLFLWSAEGAIAGAALGFAERRTWPRELHAWQLALALLLGVLIGVFACHSFSIQVLRDQFGIRQYRDYLGQPVDLMGGMLYHGWLLLFFGGLAVAAYASLRRRTRMLMTLHDAQLKRESSQKRLAEANLLALRQRVDPDTLFVKLARLERLYESDPDAADRLLDELIVFLRGALADTRRSTIPA